VLTSESPVSIPHLLIPCYLSLFSPGAYRAGDAAAAGSTASSGPLDPFTSSGMSAVSCRGISHHSSPLTHRSNFLFFHFASQAHTPSPATVSRQAVMAQVNEKRKEEAVRSIQKGAIGANSAFPFPNRSIGRQIGSRPLPHGRMVADRP
jgi:hypothetical protein